MEKVVLCNSHTEGPVARTADRLARRDAVAHRADVGDLVVHDDGLQRAARREPSASDLISAYFEIQEMLVHFWNPLWKPRKALRAKLQTQALQNVAFFPVFFFL